MQSKSWQIAQCAIAAGVAWWLAQHLLDHRQPFFAPVVALVSLGTTYGQRLRRVAEMSVGVAVGIFLGDLYTHLLGRGPWQISVMVAVAITLAVLLDASPLLINQAAVQSLVVVTVLPNTGVAFTRWEDALVGGAVALVAATIVPRAPLRRPRDQAAVVVAKLGAVLNEAAASARSGNVERAVEGLKVARSTDAMVEELRSAAAEGLSVVASSPFRRAEGVEVRLMVELTEPLDFAMRNARVLARRVAVAAMRHETMPIAYIALIEQLADVCGEIAAELKAGQMASDALPLLLALAERSSHVPRSHDLSAEVVLAQVRSIIADLLCLAGMDPVEATEAIPPLDG
ncbi:MAG: FUSC family protein [Marmoricola sp.]